MHIKLRGSCRVGTLWHKIPFFLQHIGSILGWAVLLTLIAMLVSLGVGMFNSEDPSRDVSQIFYNGLYALIDLVPLDDQEPKISEKRIIFFRLIGFSISAVVAGVLVAVCLKPVHVIKQSEIGVIDMDEKELQFRFWIMFVNKGCLYDVSTELIIAGDEDYAKRSSEINWPFRFAAPKDYGKGQDAYSKAFGVWGFSIKLDTTIEGSNETLGEMLFKILQEPKSKDDSSKKLKVRIRGTSKDGRVYYSEREYSAKDIKIGYAFEPVLIREQDKASSKCTSIMRYGNFNKAARQEGYSIEDPSNWR